jgi:hypothetical protein
MKELPQCYETTYPTFAFISFMARDTSSTSVTLPFDTASPNAPTTFGACFIRLSSVAAAEPASLPGMEQSNGHHRKRN